MSVACMRPLLHGPAALFACFGPAVKVRVGQIPEDLRVVHSGVAIGDFDMTPTFQRASIINRLAVPLHSYSSSCCAVRDVLVSAGLAPASLRRPLAVLRSMDEWSVKRVSLPERANQLSGKDTVLAEGRSRPGSREPHEAALRYCPRYRSRRNQITPSESSCGFTISPICHASSFRIPCPLTYY
jgi:hypothetical protein